MELPAVRFSTKNDTYTFSNVGFREQCPRLTMTFTEPVSLYREECVE